MSTLPTALRRQLENAIKRARKIAEAGARKALEALAVHEPDPYKHMDKEQRRHRKKLQAQASQLGDGESLTRPGTYEIRHLVEKLAYDQWHRLLFARFLLENNLLISPEHGVSVSLDDCEELAPSLGLKDAWAVAARFAAKELPEIFRADDPAGAVDLPVEDRNPLIQLVTSLPVEVFTATDSLGWCYQFWQADKKEEVRAAGNKIGADELPAVTQLFTEDYMVDFLLDNTLGAWHAGKILAANPKLAKDAQSENELRQALSLPGCPWKYLRFIQKNGKWTPAAGTFDGWPKWAQEITCLDPCMGRG
ncbi:MAG: SAM-dependent DNA methyltransferase, partial [Terriglobales bacterium]